MIVDRPARVCVIFNPTAQGERAATFRRFLDSRGDRCVLKPTSYAGAARVLSAEAVGEGFETIVAAGGDGTVNEVINGIGDAPEGFARARLAVLPVGTVNVLAKDLAIPLQMARAWDTVVAGKETLIDLPCMTFQGRSGAEKRYFVQMAGAGLDARAVELVNWNLKKKIGQFAYVLSAWQALRAENPPFTAELNSSKVTCELVIIGNGRFYGGKVPVFHRADYQDGLLDVCVFQKVNWFALLRYAIAYCTHRLVLRRSEHYFQTSTLKMLGSGAIPVELDGEAVGKLPAECTVQRQALRILTP